MRPWQAETDGQHVHYIRCFATRSCFVLCICAAPHIYSLVDVARTFHCSRSGIAGSLAPTLGWQVSNWSTVQLLLHSLATFPANPPSLYELPSPPNMPSLANLKFKKSADAQQPTPPKDAANHRDKWQCVGWFTAAEVATTQQNDADGNWNDAMYKQQARPPLPPPANG